MKFASSSALSFAWLLMMMMMMMATSALSQSDDNTSVVDTSRHPLQRGVEYYIKPAITDSGGRFTLINRNNPFPLYVGLPVTCSPFPGQDNVVMVNRDFKVAFERETTSGRRLIVTGSTNGDHDSTDYFRIVKTQTEGVYNIRWCPTEVCPLCRFDCGTIGGLRENGKILEALDGNVLPVVIERRA